MKVISINVNGIRSANRKGFFKWLARQKADVVCLQETKAQISDLPVQLSRPKNWYSYFVDANKKGYSGVAIYSRFEPELVEDSFGFDEADDEGRFLLAKFGPLSVISVYFPSGSSGPLRQEAKYRFLEEFNSWLSDQIKKRRSLIICGDWNIAHKQIDLRNWRSNKKNSGFLPEERAWLGKILEEYRLYDAFRLVDPNPDQYTWWSNRGRAWENNVGWRIDYQIISEDLADRVTSANIYKRKRFSDHAPLSITYDISL